MARARMIAKSLGASERFARLGREAGKLGEFAQALFPLVVASADDWGRLKADPWSLKWDCWPTSPRDLSAFDQAAVAMAGVGLLQLYEDQGQWYAAIVKFEEHQPGLRHDRRTSSRYPDPPRLPSISTIAGNCRELPGTSRSRVRAEPNRTEPNRSSTPPTPLGGRDAQNRIEENVQSAEGASASGHDAAQLDATGFADFWAAYPRKVGKVAAQKAWRTLKPDVTLTGEILRAVKAQSLWPQWAKDGGTFIPHASTWVNGRRWEDETERGSGAPSQPSAPWYLSCSHEPRCEKLEHHRLRVSREVEAAKGAQA